MSCARTCSTACQAADSGRTWFRASVSVYPLGISVTLCCRAAQSTRCKQQQQASALHDSYVKV